MRRVYLPTRTLGTFRHQRVVGVDFHLTGHPLRELRGFASDNDKGYAPEAQKRDRDGNDLTEARNKKPRVA
jgi:hypothetical protein